MQQDGKHNNTKQKKQRIKPVVVIFVTLLIIAAIVGAYFLISHILEQQAKREEHLKNAQTHTEKGIQNITVTTETVVAFYKLIKQAETFAEASAYDAAISTYEAAIQVAATIYYTQGIELAELGIEEMYRRIIEAKRNEAMNLFYSGDQLYSDGQYAEALEYFNKALEIYIELDDQQSIILTKARIDYSEQKIAEAEAEASIGEQTSETDETQDDTEEQTELSPNYEHNLSIHFDLRTLIDNQHQNPANQVRMGMREGLNEGWYNGCGWVAAYNAMLILGTPEHPAEIVKHFEESGGIAFGGVFGTYPNAIEEYIRSHGYRVSHTLFPQLSLNIDEVIKNSKVSILAYLHTNAAHYVTIEYKEEVDKFIVYNDSFARARSESLGHQSYSEIGAAIDSVAAFIAGTREILFSFSLIVVND